MGRSRRADSQNGVKNYQGLTTFREDLRFFKFSSDYDLNLCLYLKPELPMHMRFGFSFFSKPSYFCMIFVWRLYKAQLALSAQTNFRIQKFNTCLELENPNCKS